MNIDKLFGVGEIKEEEKIESYPPVRLPDDEAEKVIDEKIELTRISSECRAGLFDDTAIRSLARLILELKDRISEYDTIISDDASGRIPSLIFRKLINEKRKEMEKLPSEIYFLASGRHENKKVNSLIEDFVLGKKEKLGKTLLVTEYIYTGGSITPLVNFLEKEKIDFDLATVSIHNKPDRYNKQIQKHLYYGTVGDSGDSLYNIHPSAGVEKDTEKLTPHPVVNNENRELLIETRNDIKIIADELSKLLD